MPKSSTSGIYRFKPEALSNEVYSSTTFENKDNKKRPTVCFTFVFFFLFMIAFMSSFSLIYITYNDIAYYENVESDTIMQPGVRLRFIWSSEKLKFASIEDSILIPALADINDFTKQNITVYYKVINLTSFVKSLQKNDKKCAVEILDFVQHKRMEFPCMHTILHDQVYEVEPLINTTVNECGILITNATFPTDFYNATDCQPVTPIQYVKNENSRFNFKIKVSV